MKNIKIGLIIVIMLAAMSLNVQAIDTAKTIGLGNFATLDGVDALFINPAAVNNDKFFTFDLGLSASFGNNLLSNQYIDEEEKENLLKNIKDNGWIANLQAREGLNFIVGPVGIFSNFREEGVLKFNSDIAELLLKGNEIGKEYSFTGSTGAGGLYNDSGINFSYKIPDEKYRIGFSGRLLTGVIFEVEADGKSTLGYDENNELDFSGNGEFIVKHSNVTEFNGLSDLATGYAFDIGVTADVRDDLKMGFSIMNIGKITDDSGKYRIYELDSSQEEIFKLADKGDLQEQLVYNLPRKINIGGEYNYNKDLMLYFNYANISYNEVSDNKISAGTEYSRFRFLPLRLGAEYSSLENNLKLRTGFGLHFGAVKTDIGISDLLGVFNRAKGVEVGINTRVSF